MVAPATCSFQHNTPDSHQPKQLQKMGNSLPTLRKGKHTHSIPEQISRGITEEAIDAEGNHLMRSAALIT